MPPIRWRSHESLPRCGAGDYQRSSSRRRTTSGIPLLRLLLGKFGESLSLVVSSTGFLRKFWRGFVAPKAGPPARASGYPDHPHGGSGDPQVEAPAGHRRAPALGHRRWPPRSGRSAWLFFYRSDQQARRRSALSTTIHQGHNSSSMKARFLQIADDFRGVSACLRTTL